MSHYKDFKAKDFALDDSFQMWVLSPDDEKEHFWNNWIAAHPRQKEEIEEAIRMVKLAGLSTDKEANRAYLGVWENLRANAQKGQERPVRKSVNLTTYAYLAAAVSGILVISIYFFGAADDERVIYKTDFAEIREVVLTDGSTVTLNANSSLSISGAWDEGGEREVALQGEAFFSVVQTRDKKPFKIKTPSGVTVQVLGTSFNVNTRRENLSVYLQSGRVRLETGTEEIILQPGERADYDKSSRKVMVHAEEQQQSDDKLAWKSDLYIMNDLPLSTIVKDIEDNFGVSVVVQDTTLNGRRVTAKVPARDADLLLKVLSQALELEIVKDDRKIVIRPLK